MGLSAGICPNCSEHLLIKSGIPFLICPLCGESLSAREGIATLDIVCADSKKIDENIARCIKLEEKFGPQLPFQILSVLAKHFPHNEQVAYLMVKMSGYASPAVKQYLVTFAPMKKQNAFAEEFLDNSLTFRNMPWADLFEQYINNRLSDNARSRWIEKLHEMRAAFRPRGIENRATGFLYAAYVICALLNIGMAAFFILMDWHILIYVSIAAVVLFGEVLLVYLHNKKFGDRLEISETERAFMVGYMCTIMITVGGVFIGALI